MVFATLVVVDARKNVTLISAAAALVLLVKMVEGRIGVVGVAIVVVRRVGGLFALGRVFLLWML